MFAYFTIYLFSFCFSFCYSRSKDKYMIQIFKILLFLSLFLPLALRYDIGTDYGSYEHHVRRALNSGDFNEFELGWYLVIWLIEKLDLDVHFFFVIPAFFSLLIILNIIPRRIAYICIPAYVCIQYLESFSLVRQAFAVTIFLLAIKYFLRKEKLKCLFWSVVSVFFHKSAALLVLLLFFASFRLNSSTYIRSCVLFMFIIIFLSLTNFAEVIMEKVVSLTPYAWYLNSTFNKQTEMGSGLGVMLKEIIFLSVLFFNRKQRYSQDKFYNLILFSALCMGSGHILATQIHIFNRIPNIFSFFYVLFPIAIKRSNSSLKRIGIVFYEFLLLILFVKTITSAFSSLGGGIGIVPYKSIFER